MAKSWVTPSWMSVPCALICRTFMHLLSMTSASRSCPSTNWRHRLRTGSFLKQWSTQVAIENPEAIVGSGPFMIYSYRPGERLVLMQIHTSGRLTERDNACLIWIIWSIASCQTRTRLLRILQQARVTLRGLVPTTTSGCAVRWIRMTSVSTSADLLPRSIFSGLISIGERTGREALCKCAQIALVYGQAFSTGGASRTESPGID